MVWGRGAYGVGEELMVWGKELLLCGGRSLCSFISGTNNETTYW